jgi:hypothetical protein
MGVVLEGDRDSDRSPRGCLAKPHDGGGSGERPGRDCSAPHQNQGRGMESGWVAS